MSKVPSVVVVPDENVDMGMWKDKYAFHYASPQHVSDSPFKDYFGSVDRGCRLHIPPAGPERDKMNLADEKAAQALRCKTLRG